MSLYFCLSCASLAGLVRFLSTGTDQQGYEGCVVWSVSLASV